jgi:hypothetical protein
MQYSNEIQNSPWRAVSRRVRRRGKESGGKGRGGESTKCRTVEGEGVTERENRSTYIMPVSGLGM